MNILLGVIYIILGISGLTHTFNNNNFGKLILSINAFLTTLYFLIGFSLFILNSTKLIFINSFTLLIVFILRNIESRLLDNPIE